MGRGFNDGTEARFEDLTGLPVRSGDLADETLERAGLGGRAGPFSPR